MQACKGFTLIEVMITIALLVILLGLAVPGFQGLVQNTRASTLANEFTVGLTFARSEAVKRGAFVTLCPSSGSWASGWFVVPGSSCSGVGPSDAQVLRAWGAPSPRSSIQATGGVPRVTFSPLGGLDGVAPVFDIRASGCVGERARELRIGPGGSVNVRRIVCD
jgi:type IV fimbrial biogenesis protein FimT